MVNAIKCKVIILNIIISTVMLFCFTVNVSALDINDAEFYRNAVAELKDSLDKDSIVLLSSLGIEEFSPDEISKISFGNVLSTISDILVDKFNEPAKLVCIVFIIMILISLSGGLIHESGNTHRYFELISVMFIALVCFSYLINMISSTVNVIHVICGLMKLLIPILTAITAFGGNPALASSSSAISLYISEVIILICDEFLLTLLCIITAFCVTVTINFMLKPIYIIELVKKIFNYVLGLLAAVYSGVLTVRDIISAEIDKVSGNSLRFILGSSVPVVGGTLSEGLSAAISAISLFRNTFGIVGIIVIIVVIFPVFSGLICWHLSLYICELLTSAFGNDKISGLFTSFRYVVSMLISLLIFIIFIFLISVSTVLILSKK